MPKDGIPISNKYQRFVFKLEGKRLNIPVDTQISPVNPVCTIYGDYQTELSVRVDDVRVAKAKE